MSRPTSTYESVPDTEPFLKDYEIDSELHSTSMDSDETFKPSTRRRRPWHCPTVLHWITVSVLMLTTNVLLLFHVVSQTKSCPQPPTASFENGFDTDLPAAKPFIDGELVYFTGSVEFYENGTMYRSYPKDKPQYVGTPNKDIDKAWRDLMYGAAVDLPGELAGDLKDRTWKEIDKDTYRTGLEVFHQLHCLDYIRKAIYPDYYAQEDITRLFMMHVEHCIDYVRQALMCFADATPVRLEWRNDSHFLIPKFDQPHTCRNFETLQKFNHLYALEVYDKENEKKIKEKVDEGIL